MRGREDSGRETAAVPARGGLPERTLRQDELRATRSPAAADDDIFGDLYLDFEDEPTRTPIDRIEGQPPAREPTFEPDPDDGADAYEEVGGPDAAVPAAGHDADTRYDADTGHDTDEGHDTGGGHDAGDGYGVADPAHDADTEHEGDSEYDADWDIDWDADPADSAVGGPEPEPEPEPGPGPGPGSGTGFHTDPVAPATTRHGAGEFAHRDDEFAPPGPAPRSVWDQAPRPAETFATEPEPVPHTVTPPAMAPGPQTPAVAPPVPAPPTIAGSADATMPAAHAVPPPMPAAPPPVAAAPPMPTSPPPEPAPQGTLPLSEPGYADDEPDVPTTSRSDSLRRGDADDDTDEPLGPPLGIQASAWSTSSHPGRRRAARRERRGLGPELTARDNDDRYAATGEVFIVADGLGGHPAGWYAADVAVRTLVAELAGADLSAGWSDRLGAAIAVADLAVRRHGVGEYEGMRTTVVAAVMQHGRLHLAGCGDSVCWLVRGGRAFRLTEQGNAAEFGRPWLLTSTPLGGSQAPEPELQRLELHPGDRIVLSTDGVGHLPDETIADLVHGDPFHAALALTRTAVESGDDDATAVVVECDALPVPEGHRAGADPREAAEDASNRPGALRSDGGTAW